MSVTTGRLMIMIMMTMKIIMNMMFFFENVSRKVGNCI